MNTEKKSWSELITQAVNEPGEIMKAYNAFHRFSYGNVLLAWAQCLGRNIPLGPIATYPGWQQKGRHIKRGEKALTLCMPVTVKNNDQKTDEEEYKTIFI